MCSHAQSLRIKIAFLSEQIWISAVGGLPTGVSQSNGRGRASNRRIAVEWAGGEIRRLLADSIVISLCPLLS